MRKLYYALVAIASTVLALSCAKHAREIGASENYATPVGDASTGDFRLTGSYPYGLTPFGLAAACSNGQFLGGVDGSIGCAIPTADGGSVAGFTAGQDLYGTNSAQGISGITGDAAVGYLPIGAAAGEALYAAGATPSWQQTATSGAHGADMIQYPQWSTAVDGGGGRAGAVLPVPVGPAGPESSWNLWRGDAGLITVTPAPGNVTGGVAVYGLGATPDAGNFAMYISGPDTVASLNGTASSQLCAGTTGCAGGTTAFAVNAISGFIATGSPFSFYENTSNPLITQQTPISDFAPTTMTVRAASAYASAVSNTTGAPLNLQGGAAVSSGINEGVRLQVGASSSTTLFEVAQPANGQNVTVLNQIGSGIGTSSFPNGNGFSVLYNAATCPTTCDSTRVSYWACAGVFYFCNAGGSPVPVPTSGGGGSVTLGGDAVGPSGSNTVQTITGNGSGIVNSSAQYYSYTGGGGLEWASNNTITLAATNTAELLSTSGTAYMQGAAATVQSSGATNISGASLTENATSGNLTLQVGGTNEAVFSPSSTIIQSTGGFLTLQAASGWTGLATTGTAQMISSAGPAQVQSAGQLNLTSTGSSVYVAAGPSQIIHEQVNGTDELTIDGTGEINFSNAQIAATPGGTGVFPKAAGYFYIKVNGVQHILVYF